MSRSPMRFAVVATVLTVFFVSSCAVEEVEERFAISLVESGEVVLSEEHIAEYVLDTHTIVLTPGGLDRWKSFIKYDGSHEPPTPQLGGGLAGKEFVVTIAGKEMYRGHFWSMLMSSLGTGVQIYDTLIVVRGTLSVRIQRLENEPKEDPRGRREIVAYFREKDKLR